MQPIKCFTVVPAKPVQSVDACASASILQAIERATSVAVECLCHEGVCGMGETRFLEGGAEYLGP